MTDAANSQQMVLALQEKLLGWEAVIARSGNAAAHVVGKRLVAMETWAPDYDLDQLHAAGNAVDDAASITSSQNADAGKGGERALVILAHVSPIARIAALLSMAQKAPQSLGAIIAIRPRSEEIAICRHNVTVTILHLLREAAIAEIYGDESRQNRVAQAVQVAHKR